jgi:hypothetical protein
MTPLEEDERGLALSFRPLFLDLRNSPIEVPELLLLGFGTGEEPLQSPHGGDSYIARRKNQGAKKRRKLDVSEPH